MSRCGGDVADNQLCSLPTSALDSATTHCIDACVFSRTPYRQASGSDDGEFVLLACCGAAQSFVIAVSVDSTAAFSSSADVDDRVRG